MKNTRSNLCAAIEPMLKAHTGKSGMVALSDGYDAFAARMMLADSAESTLDVQCYIWENDMTGTLLFESLHRAADRGVHIRLLLDDNNTGSLDSVIATLNSHPDIEIRLFNPFLHRRWRVLEYLTDFARVNRRMHNKSFTADKAATIIGGRNVGDEYFNAGQELFFIDLDVLAIGPVVDHVSRDFDRYWSSDSSYPADKVLGKGSAKSISGLSKAASIVEHDSAARRYMHALADSPFARDLRDYELPFEWTDIHMVSDDPAKGMGLASDHMLLPQKLTSLLDMPKKELLLVVPYFVPGAAGVEFFSRLARQNIRIAILTNSFEATDVAIVHAGYSKRRKKLLEAGVALYELKYSVAGRPGGGKGLTGSSSSSLHAKTFSVDRSCIFIGSFNFDPRSARLNTEMGFIIDSPSMARTAAGLFADKIPSMAYEVRLNDRGNLIWVERSNGKEVIHEKEPGIGFRHRIGMALSSRLPIEWLL